MSRPIRTVLLISLIGLCLVGGMTTTKATTALIVNSTTDVVDANPGNGVCETVPGNNVCTLRAAIQEANALPGADTIYLPSGTYTLNIPGDYENASVSGDLDLTHDLTITGADASSTIIDGGALDRIFDVISAASATISDVTIQNGMAGEGGGAIRVRVTGKLLLKQAIIQNNIAPYGGGIENSGGITTVVDSTIQGNRATYSVSGDGGGINNVLDRSLGFITEPSLTLANVIVSDNIAAGSGGGVATMLGTVHISNSLVRDNTATVNGGGIGVVHAGVYGRGARVYVTNTTVSGNVVTIHFGGGLFNTDTLILTNVTVSENVASVGGGIFGIAWLKNTLLANNHGTTGDGPNCNGSIISQGHNLIQNSLHCFLEGDLTGNLLDVDAQLGPLHDNGGSTLTYALLPGSPAIDAGSPAGCTDSAGELILQDQRGITRPQDGNNDGTARCDIGAYELASASDISTPTSTSAATPSPSPTQSPTATATPAPTSCLAYGVADVGSAASQFFTLDARTITIRNLGPRQENADIEAVALHPATNELFTTTGSDGSQDGYLFHFDYGSNTLTAIGATGYSKVNALAFRPSDDSLWGWVADQGLIQINPSTGASRLIHRASGDSSAMAWSADGTQLYVASGTQLWAYNPLSDALTTLGANFPSTSIVLSMRSDGRLLGGVEHDHILALFLYDLARRQVVARTTIPVPYDDLEAITWPGVCADALMSDVPALALSSVDRGAPESYFPLHATGFTPRAAVTLTVNSARIGTATADAGGKLLFTLHFNTQAAPGVYAINAREQPAAGTAVGATWGAETQVIVDIAAAQLPRSSDVLVVDGTLAVYLPLVR
jgi:CSLREA domain-containing protein